MTADERLSQHIQKAVDQFPGTSDEKLDRIAGMLRAGNRANGEVS